MDDIDNTHVILVPRVGKPKELVRVVHTDHGDTLNPPSFTSEFEIGGIMYRNDFNPGHFNPGDRPWDFAKRRWKSDCKFLAGHDLHLAKFQSDAL